MTRRREISPLVFFYLPRSLWLTCQSEHSQSLESVIFKSCHYTSQVWQKIRKWTTGFNHDRFQVLEIFPEATPKTWHFLKPLLLWAHVCILTQSREPHLWRCGASPFCLPNTVPGRQEYQTTMYSCKLCMSNCFFCGKEPGPGMQQPSYVKPQRKAVKPKLPCKWQFCLRKKVLSKAHF